MDVQSAFPPAAAIRTPRDETCVLRPSGLETTGLLSGPVMNDSKPSKPIFFFPTTQRIAKIFHLVSLCLPNFVMCKENKTL